MRLVSGPQVSDAEHLEVTNADLAWCENPECPFFPPLLSEHMEGLKAPMSFTGRGYLIKGLLKEVL